MQQESEDSKRQKRHSPKEEDEKEKKKANKFQLAFEKFKEALNKLTNHPFIEKYINYISFSVILLILIFVYHNLFCLEKKISLKSET